MEVFLTFVEFFGGLILFFGLCYFIGSILDKYLKK